MTYQYILDLIDSGLIRKGKALDLGCGPGQASVLLSSLEFDVEAVDMNNQPVSTSLGNISFSKIDIRDFDIKKNKYAFINARNVLHFLRKDEMKMMVARMFKGLKKGGVMYFNVSGDKDGWVEKSKDVVTFLNEKDLVHYIERELKMPVYSKVTKLGFGNTTKGIMKYTHTISYTVVK
jgi:trans-aconitate methyltransferase